MATQRVLDVLDAIADLPVSELADLHEALVTRFRIVTHQPATTLTPPAPAVAPDPTAYTVRLTTCGPRRVEVIKALRAITGLGLMEAKALADMGGVVKEAVPTDMANEIRTMLEATGATISLGAAWD